MDNKYDDIAENIEVTEEITQLERQLKHSSVEGRKMLQDIVKIIGVLKKRQDATDAQMETRTHHNN